MSTRNGNRSRSDRQRRAKLHNRTRIRELRKALAQQETGAQQRSETGAEMRFVEYFSMAQSRHAMVSGRSLQEVPLAHFVRSRPHRRSGKTPTFIGRKTGFDLSVGRLQASGGLHRRCRLALSKATG